MSIEQHNKLNPNPEPTALIARARAMIPDLRRRAARCEAECRIPEESLAEIKAAGLFKIVQPRRYGGYQMGWDVFNDVILELAAGCASTGWIYSVVGQHPLLANRYGTDLMAEIWGRNPDALISSSQHILGGLTKVEGGYRGSATATFSSGCLHADWVLVGNLPVEDADYRVGAVIPIADIEVLDTWHALGLAGTGSHDIRFNDVFVPEHRTMIYGRAPAREVIDAPVYRVSAPGGPFTLASVLVGAAQGALDDFVASTKPRTSRQGIKIATLQSLQMRVGESLAEITAAKALIRGEVRRVMAALEDGRLGAKAGQTPQNYRRIDPKISLFESFAAQLAYAATERIFYAAGASALTDGANLQRCFRDIVAGSRQIGLQWDIARTNAGQEMLGVEL